MSELSEEYWKVCDENLVFDSQSANRDNCPYCRNELIRISCPACVKSSPAPPVIDWWHARSLRSLGGLAI